MTLSIIGAGFGRTGTLSLKMALDQLGSGPCYHMTELFRHPEHADLWNSAADDPAVADWETIFDGYPAVVDWPGSYFWRTLADRYPQAKVLLTVRPAEKWYESVMNTIYHRMVGEPKPDIPIVRAQMAMAKKIVLDHTFDGRIEDRAHAIAVYEKHNAEVQAAVDPERLLVYQAAEGWAPLCEFLGVDAPDEPFPRVNTTEDFPRDLQKK